MRVGGLGGLTELAGVQVLLAIRLGVLPQVQEQVVLRVQVWDQQSHHRQY